MVFCDWESAFAFIFHNINRSAVPRMALSIVTDGLPSGGGGAFADKVPAIVHRDCLLKTIGVKKDIHDSQ